MMRTWLSFLMALTVAAPAFGAEIEGTVTDRSGGVLADTVVTATRVSSGQRTETTTDAAGEYRFPDLRPGMYRLAVSRLEFSDMSRTVIIGDAAEVLTADFALALGSFRDEVTVAAARGERDLAIVPLRVDTVAASTTYETTPTSTGEVLANVPGVTLVGSGPFQIRPRLRGLDSTRVLVLVDGKRLNNARTATDRAGVEVGLIGVDTVSDIEVLGGAGSVLYGTDALSGTINIITNRPRLTDTPQLVTGFDGYYSSNENGRRATVTLGFSSPKWGVSFKGGADRFDNYEAGGDFEESSVGYLEDGVIVRDDTIDDNFGLSLGAFPDPFNGPFTRTAREVPNSSMRGSSAQVSVLGIVAPSQTIEFNYQRRRAEDVGFPDFEEPFFFQRITLPWSQLDRFSATYSATDVTPWLTRVVVSPYYQRQDRLLRNRLPVQFPVPSPRFFPIDVFGLDILSDTRQQVWTPGVDVQATLVTRPDNVLTVGATVFQDRSEDDRTTTTQMTQIGQVGIGMFGPAATVLPAPLSIGPPEVEHPVRVPHSTFRDVGVFLHDEWTSPTVRLTGGLRLDAYRVHTDATPGYDIESLIVGATPAIDPATLPDIEGHRTSRTALTGEAGIVLMPDHPVSVFAHYVRSYRHPNLEELLFSGPATTGNIVRNVTVEPETGHNVDVGVRVRTSRVAASLSYFNNTYSNFISTEVVSIVESRSGTDSISQAINLSKVRIQGVEAEARAPIVAGNMMWMPYGSLAYNHGEVLSGTSPFSGLSLDGEPQDNITPWKATFGLRASDRRERAWASYSVRAQGEITRVSPLLSDSPFLIAQDLLGLAGFSVHRIAIGYDWRAADQRVGLTFAIDNLTDAFYREQYQFAPARGRSFSVMFTVRGNE